jgi:DNA polymerase IV
VRVGVKVRFAPFFTHTRSLTLPPTTSAEDVTASARVLLDRFEPGRPVRLLGVRADIDRAR